MAAQAGYLCRKERPQPSDQRCQCYLRKAGNHRHPEQQRHSAALHREHGGSEVNRSDSRGTEIPRAGDFALGGDEDRSYAQRQQTDRYEIQRLMEGQTSLARYRHLVRERCCRQTDMLERGENENRQRRGIIRTIKKPCLPRRHGRAQLSLLKASSRDG
jgi:hypothetical protein